MIPKAEFRELSLRGAIRILLVEDDPDFARIVRRDVDAVGWAKLALECVGTLRDALSLLAQGGIDLVVTDLNLPDSKRLETLDSLVRATDRLIIVLTGEYEPALYEEAIKRGAYDLVNKDRLDRVGLERLMRLASMQANTFRSLRESEARFRSLTELLSDWYWEQDEELRFTRIEGPDQTPLPGFKSNIGKRRWELEGIELTPEQWTEHRKLLDARLPFHGLELPIRDAAGARRWVSASGEPMRDASGRFTGYRGTAREITASKRAEQLRALELSVARLFAETLNAADALKSAIRAICETEHWDCGRYLWVDITAGVLRFGEAWSMPNADIERYIDESRSMVYAPGVGLVGKVWQSQQPLWVADITDDPRVARPGLARATGMRGAFAIPVAAEGKTIGVLIFHSQQIREPDEQLLGTLRVIGGQIGQFVQRANAEQAVRESEARFRSLTQLSSDWYWEQDEQFRFTRLSGPGASAMSLDGDPSVYLGKARWQISDLEHMDGDWSRHREQLERREPFRDLLLRRRMRDGTSRYMSVSGEPMFDEAGRFQGYRGVASNVTARIEAEHALRESEAQLHLVADNVPAMICYFGADCRYRYANLTYRQFYTGSAAPIDGRTLKEVLGGQTWQTARPNVERALAGEFTNYILKRRRSSDGSLRELDVSLVPHKDETGRVLGVYGLLVDVSRRRRAEEALRLRNRAIESSVNSIMITKPTKAGQEIVYVNPAFERITGYTAAEVLGKHARFLYGEDREQPGVEALRNATREQREATVLLRNYRKDGTMFWNELHVAPVRDQAGRVTHMIGVASDVTDRVRYQEEIERNANYDTLTGLPNRNLLNDRLAQAAVQAGRSGRPLGVMFVDLDHLKRINDTLGHEMGDKVIVATGRRIAESLRAGDTVARLSGDEFVILLVHLKRGDDAALVATKILNCIGTPLKIEGHEFVLTASAGIALHPKDGTDVATLLRNSDAALFRAKEDGRDCLRFFAPEMNERVVQFLALERDLRRGLELQEFRLQYQPIVRIATGEAIGAEALIRWRRADGSVVEPAQFIPVAEESGLIVPIGRWVMETAARQAGEWNLGRRTSFFVSINLSARQFRDPGLLETVRTAIKSAKVNASLIKLEITESTVMQNPEEATRLLRALKGLGVKLSVDDFGTGYSSLGYLKRFPIDTLKIDRSFVRDLPADRDALAISRAVIELGRGMDLEVIAEGVETHAQSRTLAANNCELAQGYLFGRPVDPEQFDALPAARPAPRRARRPATRNKR